TVGAVGLLARLAHIPMRRTLKCRRRESVVRLTPWRTKRATRAIATRTRDRRCSRGARSCALAPREAGASRDAARDGLGARSAAGRAPSRCGPPEGADATPHGGDARATPPRLSRL